MGKRPYFFEIIGGGGFFEIWCIAVLKGWTF